MVFTQAALNQFFTAADQMAIPELTRQQLALEGITGVEDLSEFDKDGIKQLANNLQRTGRRIPDPANANATVPALPFVFGTKSQQRLAAACEVARYYETVGRTMTPINMRWMGAIKAFIPHWKALTDKKKNDDVPDVPKITKALVVIKWTEAFGDFLNRVLGRRFIPLAYVIRPESVVPAAAPDLATGQPYGAIFGSVEEELVQRGHTTMPSSVRIMPWYILPRRSNSFYELCCIYQAVPTCQEWTRSLAGNGGAICRGGQVESRVDTPRRPSSQQRMEGAIKLLPGEVYCNA
jgi:hypothetical protein